MKRLALKVLGQNYRQIIFIIVLIGCFFPAFFPIGLPISTSPLTVKAYRFIEALKADDLVLVSIDYGPGGWAEIGPGMNAVVQHLFLKKVNIVFVSFVTDGPAMTEKLLKEIDIAGAKYGVNYAILGYMPGDEVAMAAFAENPLRITKDYYGNEIGQLDIMKKITTIGDFKLYIPAHITGPEPWIRQFYGKVQTIIMVISPAALSLVQPWVDSGHLYSMIPGTKGGGEYEVLLRKPGIATSIMDATSLTLTLVMVLIIIGNIVYRKERSKEVRGGG
ncbi:MAG: hypothetical protein QW486_07150 [Candidatus Bathyarchaeia archaeon]